MVIITYGYQMSIAHGYGFSLFDIQILFAYLPTTKLIFINSWTLLYSVLFLINTIITWYDVAAHLCRVAISNGIAHSILIICGTCRLAIESVVYRV